MDKRMRRRMTLIKTEQERARKAQFPRSTSYASTKSYDEIRQDKEANFPSPDDSDEERDDNASLVSECVSEMRRRRIYEMTHGCPYPGKSTKKKHTFWQPEEVSLPTNLVSPSERSHRSTLTTTPALKTPPAVDPVQEPSSTNTTPKKSGSKQTNRILWRVETNNLEQNFEALVVEESMEEERQKLKDSFIRDEIVDGYGYEDDEIMTPVRIKKVMDIYDDVKREGETPEETAVTVAEISAATQALAAFVTSAVGVMKEAKTPEKDVLAKPVVDRKYIDSLKLSGSKVTKRLAATPFNAAKNFFQDMASSTATPSHKVINKVYTPPTAKTTDSCDTGDEEEDIVVTKLVLEDSEEAQKNDMNSVLWPSLFLTEDPGPGNEPMDTVTKSMLEALVQGGALQPEIDGKNMLKLFVDMYHKYTFEKILHALRELKGLNSLVICRGIDKNRSTYRTPDEMKALFDATKSIETLDSLMLLNFTSTNGLADMIHSHPFLFRLQIQLMEGTLNGEILGVMATSPQLTHVVLELNESCSFGALMSSKTIETVHVNSKDLVLTNNHIRSLVYSLQSNFSLTTLDLAPSISVDHFRSLCTILKDNYRLESLRINLKCSNDEESAIVASELANLFRENSFLMNVWNYSSDSCSISEASKCSLMASLRRNKSMKDFKFFKKDLGDWKNFEGGNPSWLEENLNNTTLGSVSTAFWDGPAQSFETTNTSFDSIETKSVRADEEVLAMCGLESSDFHSTLCGIECADVKGACAGVKQNFTKFQTWANETTQKAKRMELI